MITFFEKLEKRLYSSRTYLCVGLVPVLQKIPEHINLKQFGVFDFFARDNFKN